jgi:hypothetical protein
MRIEAQPGSLRIPHSAFKTQSARVTTADAEQTTVAAFRPWRGS